jgi:histidinol-phosphate/aromatic aminotransferase/cobyric acid decarboxylase-like protein
MAAIASGESVAGDIAGRPNLCVLRTLSKAHGLAGARCGALIADPAVIALGRKVIPPYAIAELTVEVVAPLLAPNGIAAMRARVAATLSERARLVAGLADLSGTLKLWPTEANFVLVDFRDPDEVLRRVRGAGLIIRDVRQPALPQSLRISVGTPEQDDRLLRSLQ